jgi:putative CocE/NonD family hydrolase
MSKPMSSRTLEQVPLGDIDEHAEQVMVPMRDGVRLATDVYLEPGGERRPAVLVRLPYDKSARFSFMISVAPRFLERGYAFVAQDVRGKARSEGETFAFVSEVADGADTLDWIVEQPWSNGAVAMFGDSYYGFTQWAAAASGHPALRAIVPRVTTTEIGTDWMYHQGVFCLYTMAEWAAATWIDAPLYEGPPDFSVRPLADVVPAVQGGRGSASFDRWRSTQAADAFWTAEIFGTADPLARVSIPVLHCGGWWDVFQRGQLRDHARLVTRGAGGQHLLMGSTDHFDDELADDGTTVEDILVSEEALERFLPAYVGPALAFLDRYVLGREERIDPVRWHLANAGWRKSATWPPADARSVTLFAGGAGALTGGPEGGVLDERAGGRGAIAWDHDPANLVPDLVEDAWRPLLGLPDERTVEQRRDVATFTGAEAARPLDLAGPVTVRGTTGERHAPGALVAKLVDVFPNGRARRILQGASATEPGAAFSIDLGSTGYRLLPSHRLRLEVAASDFPRYLPDAGPGLDPWAVGEGAPAPREVRLGDDGLRLVVTELPS